jgi:uncharacterized protein YhfF
MGGLADCIRCALSNPLNDDHAIDPMCELADVLREVGLEPRSSGGAVTFTGRDPIISSPLPFATMAAVALMAKAVSVAALWRVRGGQGQDLSINLGKALHRLCPFYDKKWELLNGYAPGNPADPKNPFMPTNMYRTRDNRRILFMNIYPGSRSAALAFLGCNDDPTAIGSVIRKWDAFDLEEQAILNGTKTLTSSPFWDYPDGKIPFVGALGVLLDGSRRPRGIVETTRVEIMPFGSITEEMARAYGEGERTVEWWRRVMGAFYSASAVRHNAILTDDTSHIWEWFTVVHRL